MEIIQVCQWIGDNDVCRQSTIFGKSYCETHYAKSYITVPTSVADDIIDKELSLDDDYE